MVSFPRIAGARAPVTSPEGGSFADERSAAGDGFVDRDSLRIDKIGQVGPYVRIYGSFIFINAQLLQIGPECMRKDGRPKRARNIVLEDQQYEILELHAEQNPLGRVTISSMVRKAVQEFIDSQLTSNQALRERIERRA